MNAIFKISEDTPFTQLKIREIPAWISRRNKTPAAMISCMSRGKYVRKYVYSLNGVYSNNV